MNTKPRLKLADLSKPLTPVEKARQRHGKPFAFESGSTWTKHATPVLTQWMQKGGARK